MILTMPLPLSPVSFSAIHLQQHPRQLSKCCCCQRPWQPSGHWTRSLSCSSTSPGFPFCWLGFISLIGPWPGLSHQTIAFCPKRHCLKSDPTQLHNQLVWPNFDTPCHTGFWQLLLPRHLPGALLFPTVFFTRGIATLSLTQRLSFHICHFHVGAFPLRTDPCCFVLTPLPNPEE